MHENENNDDLLDKLEKRVNEGGDITRRERQTLKYPGQEIRNQGRDRMSQYARINHRSQEDR